MTVWIIIVIGIFVVVGVGVVASAKSRRSSAQPPLSSDEDRNARSERIGLEKFKCEECGAELGKNDIAAREGLTFISCSYCGSTYQLVEDPK